MLRGDAYRWRTGDMQQANATVTDYRNVFRGLAYVMAALLLSTLSTIACAADNAPVPKRQAWVTDNAHVLSAAARNKLSDTLSRYEDETGHQIAVLIVPDLAGESIEAFSLRVANAWRLGNKGYADGILVTLAMQDRNVRIELGDGLEHYISNDTAQSIVNDFMLPAFAKGHFAQGLEEGVKWLMHDGRRFVLPATADKKPAP
jgi:uncharacterized protein